MRSIRITHADASKPTGVLVGTDLLGRIGKVIPLASYSQILVVSGPHVAKLYLKRVRQGMPTIASYVLPGGERVKTPETVTKLHRHMKKLGLDRRSLLVSLGGGVTGDIGGFAAATYQRGIDSLLVPTTLVAQADASIGGKTGVNLDSFKNYVGTFHHPIAVVSDVSTLHTLPERQFISGLAEVLKLGTIRDAALFRAVGGPLESDRDRQRLITRAVTVKAGIIRRDPDEHGPRMLLNFGHTAGHAYETWSLGTAKPLLHGEAVAIGMRIESRLAQLLGLCSEHTVRTIEESLNQAGLARHPNAPSGTILRILQGDKKKRGDSLTWALPTRIGAGRLTDRVPTPAIRRAIGLAEHS